MTKKFICVWDFDSPLYAAATILDKLYIEVLHNKSGRIKNFKNMTEFWGRGKAIGGWLSEQKGSWLKEDFTLTPCTKRNPSISIKKAKEILTTQIEAVAQKDFCKELKLVVGGEGNYRQKIYPLYKSNRKAPKPTTLKELKKWLSNNHEIIMEDGIEADDVMGIMGEFGLQKALRGNDYNLNDICLIYIDKDINQKVGWKWDPTKKLKAPIWNNEFDAAKSFWVQMLQGDTTDNIPGLKGVSPEVWKNYGLRGRRFGVGKTNAQVLLADCKNALQMEEKVLYFYKSYWEQFGEDWKHHFQINYQMLKLMEKRGVIPKYEF